MGAGTASRVRSSPYLARQILSLSATIGMAPGAGAEPRQRLRLAVDHGCCCSRSRSRTSGWPGGAFKNGYRRVRQRRYGGALRDAGLQLKPKGKELAVTEQNKREYVDLLAAWRLRESVEQQFQALRSGLSRVVDPSLLKNFDENELEWLIGGLPVIDASDWRKHTVYKAGYSDTSDCHVIRWFWQLLES